MTDDDGYPCTVCDFEWPTALGARYCCLDEDDGRGRE